MKYYSELTNKIYDSEKECKAAEEKKRKSDEEETLRKKKEAEQRKTRAAAVEEKRVAYSKAKEAYINELDSFIKDYGSYHTTIKDTQDFLDSFRDLFW